LDYLHGVYPQVHISLHAGELAFGLVPPEGLRFHIRDSIERGHAERIGQGVDIMHERDPLALLHRMAQQGVLVEVCLTSNEVILGIRGNDHPLPIYLKYGVPVSLATDDEGVLRSDLTQEFLRAAETYDFLTYRDLKRMVRLSLEHSFLPGASLWSDSKTLRRGNGCTATPDEPSSGACQKFLAASERARLQWRLEEELADFENKY
jgi:adenosine deaminase